VNKILYEKTKKGYKKWIKNEKGCYKKWNLKGCYKEWNLKSCNKKWKWKLKGCN